MNLFKHLIGAFAPEPPRSGLICMGEGDDPAGGGGGGGGGGGDESITVSTKQLGNMVNSAVTAHMKRVDFSGMIGSSVTEAMKGLNLGGAAPAAPAAPADQASGGSGGDQQDSGRADPRDLELAKMKAEQQRIKDKLAASEAAAEAEKQAAKVLAERSALSDALRQGGVDDARLGAAAAYLYLDQKVVKRDDDGNICMEIKREWGPELVPVKDGIAEYLKTDAGKVFLPPVDAGGSGHKGGRPPMRSKAGEKPTRKDLLDHLGNLMMDPNPRGR